MSRAQLVLSHISDLNTPWASHLPWLDTHPSRRTTAQQGPDWPHGENRSSHPVKQRDKKVAFCSGRHVAKCLSFPPSRSPDSSTSESGFKVEFGSAAPSHLCSPTEISRAAQASSCYSEPVTLGLSIKLQTLRITSFVMIHVTNQSVQ